MASSRLHRQAPNSNSCSSSNKGKQLVRKPFIGTSADYSDPDNWLALPAETSLPADVIFLYPTACMTPDAPPICELHDPATIQQAKDYLAQSGAAFEGVGNIFAPLWRQVSASFVNTRSFEEVDEAQWAEPRTDVFAAMDYYFENLNGGRPWIIAGHSQGSRLLGMVLGEYMAEHPDYYARMICAYRIGDGGHVWPRLLTHLRLRVLLLQHPRERCEPRPEVARGQSGCRTRVAAG